MKTTDKMKVEIWSDITCPFCYIGKRNFEKAIERLDFKESIEVEWKSMQLIPDLQTDPSLSITDDFKQRNQGLDPERIQYLNTSIVQQAAEVGLDYHLEKATIANSLNGHRLIHYAKEQGKQDEAKEALFSAYFVEGLNIDNSNTLMGIGKKLGMDETELQKMLQSDRFIKDVQEDVREGVNIGVSGVPFFVLDGKQKLSGARPIEVFQRSLENSYSEWKKTNEQPKTGNTEDSGNSCTIDGVCE